MSLRPYLSSLSGYKRFWIVYVAVLALDQVTKLAVVHGTAPTAPGELGTSVIPKFFWLTHVYNKGAAWSIGAGNQGWLVILAVAALAAMYRWRVEIGLRDPVAQLTLGAFAGGAIGNVIDRLAYDHVVDFLLFRIPLINYYWPAFNIADMGITVGAALYTLHGFRAKPMPAAV